MSLFDATVSQIVKDVSDQTLIPVPCRNLADYCKITWLVQRKTRSWHLPWKSAYKYIPTEFKLNDILTEPIDVAQQKPSVLLENYASTPSFHKAGKIGGKIAEEFDVDVSVNETMQVSLKLGNVMKQEVLWQTLFDTFNGKLVKTDHPLLKEIKSSQRKSLFLIGMVVTCSFTGTIDKGTDIEAEVGGKPYVALNLSSSGSSETKRHRQYAIPPHTTLAYSCYRLKVENNGALNLQLGTDLTDAPFIGEEKIFEAKSVEEVLSGLFTNEVGNDLIIMLRKILKSQPTCGFKLNVVVENAIDILKEEHVQCVITRQHLEKMFPNDCMADCFKFLEIAGFQTENKLVYQGKRDLLPSLNALLDCLSEMNNTQIKILTECDVSHKNDILLAMQKAVERTDAKIEFSNVFANDHPVVRFLKSVGLDLVRSESSFQLKYLPTCQSVLQLRSSMVAVYGMCSV